MGDSAHLDKPHVPLAKFRVLYIGRAAPKAALNGIESIQKPLCELYTKDEFQSKETDTDAVLTVLTSGILMEPVNPLDGDLWLPIQNLQSCAAVKAVVEGCGGQGTISFIPVDSPVIAGSSYPPIFSCVMGRSNGLPLQDCYAFICQSTDAALLIVQATMHAFGNKSGWACDRPTKKALTASAGQCRQEQMVISGSMDNTPAEFYERPPLGGFFYTPSPNLIQKYHIQGASCSTTQAPSWSKARSPYTSSEQPMKPPSTAPAPAGNQGVVPMVFFDTEQDALYVDRRFGPEEPIPFPPGGLVRFSEAPKSQAVAFNPYLIPALDPLPPSTAYDPPSMAPRIVKTSNEPVPKEFIAVAQTRDPVIVPVVQQKVGHDPRTYGHENPIYQKRLPRSQIGLDQAYANQMTQNDRNRSTSNIGVRPFVDNTPEPIVVVAKQEELYAHRLPPPIEEPLPQGCRQFDCNFILQQSDTDKARIADVKNHQGYPAPMPVNIAEFGY